jgi:uncharacterized lipoprotein YddW (UPF0748 family)
MRKNQSIGLVLLLSCAICYAGVAYGPEGREARGVWLRPPADPSKIPALLDTLTTAGFNMVFVETFYHGFTLYPGSIVPPRPEYGDTDVLGIFVKEGHKRGLQVHAWVEVFYWQVDTEKYPKLPRTPLFDQHPEWRFLLRDGQDTGASETAHIFANPAHPEVRRFLLNYFKELITRYDLDGLDLDYIRYPAGAMDAGYDDFSRKKFSSETGIDPMNIDRAKQPDAWKKWVEWRENQVTEFVKQVARMVRQTKPQILLSADVFGSYYDVRMGDFHFQDWAAWTKENLLDVIIPMAYGPTLDSIKDDILKVRDKAGTSVMLIPGLAISTIVKDAYRSPSHPPIAEQISLVRNLGFGGECIFCYDWIVESPEGFAAFAKGPYAVRALPPQKKAVGVQR